ncbi:hypothetical protein LTR53_010780 [Teratosphaeriaceae sp. CCFEE 6253]|nr:hypothetical protein LTR53_010780 [Teratosphaeriaceae sp. CCFEE 6253]
MSMWHEAPPEPRSRMQNWPTLLYSHWATAFSAVIIVTRICGRKVRSGVLFKEDWIMLAAMAPLIARMAVVHFVLIYGTNNIATVGHNLSAIQLQHHSEGAKLVLAARILYAAFIWMSKLTGIRVFLAVTFAGVVVATLGECRPFDHYYQVIPDPGPQCRSGYAQLLTMSVCDIITDILLVVFPIPIVLRSGQSWRRKAQLTCLFSLSLIMIAITATRVPMVVEHRGRQQYRTVWASSEILASTAVSNAVILGSFLRDKGTKKNKFRSQSVSDSIEQVSIRRPTMAALQRVGSDEDLFRFLGCRVPDHLMDEPTTGPRLATAAPSASAMKRRDSQRHCSEPRAAHEVEESASDADRPSSHERPPSAGETSPAASTKRSVSFFDVGGLLEDGAPAWDTRSRATTLVEYGPPGTIAQDFATPSPMQSRRGSRTFLADIGGLMGPGLGRHGHSNAGPFARRHSDAQTLHRHRGTPMRGLGPMLERGGLSGDGDEDGLQHSQASETGESHRTPTVAQQACNGGVVQLPRAVKDSSMQSGHNSDEHEARGPPARPDDDEMILHDPGGLLNT